MTERVIYTCLTGGYDRLEQPAVVDPAYDYICFTDTDGQDGVWQLRKIPFDSPDPVTRSRYPKILPHQVLPEYAFSVYLDANLRIMDAEFYRIVEQRIAEGARFAQVGHPRRDCIYDELRYCYLKDRIRTGTAFRLYRQWTGEALPRHAGLYENNLILRAHNDLEIITLDEAWWEAFAHSGGRDQLALQPVFLRAGFRPTLLLGPGLNARNVPFLQYTLHPAEGKKKSPAMPGMTSVLKRLTWANARYHLRLAFRKCVLRIGLFGFVGIL